jgi:Flp pilus assembly protein TadD
VRTALLDPQSRESYNIKLDIAVSEDLIALEAQGDEVAVSEGDSDSELSVRLEAARKAIEGGDQSGVAILSQLRVLNPSDPNVLAELGWATWKFADEGNSSGQEFLQLALTFDPRHVLALEYLGKIAQSEDDVEQATDLAARVQKLEPENAWAKAALTTVPNEEKKAKKKSRFWRRGD